MTVGQIRVYTYELFVSTIASAIGVSEDTLVDFPIMGADSALDSIQVYELDVVIEEEMGVLMPEDTWLQREVRMHDLYEAYISLVVDNTTNDADAI